MGRRAVQLGTYWHCASPAVAGVLARMRGITLLPDGVEAGLVQCPSCPLRSMRTALCLHCGGKDMVAYSFAMGALLTQPALGSGQPANTRRHSLLALAADIHPCKAERQLLLCHVPAPPGPTYARVLVFSTTPASAAACASAATGLRQHSATALVNGLQLVPAINFDSIVHGRCQRPSCGTWVTHYLTTDMSTGSEAPD